jgi:hypothetical protein
MSKKRLFRALTASAVLTTALLLAVSATAAADVVTVGGPPAGGGNSSTPNTPGNTYCELDATGSTIGVLGGKTIYIAPFAGCTGVGVGHAVPGTWGGTNVWGLCLSEYVVWSFYGTQSSPADGVTISIAYLPKACDSAGPAGINTTTSLSYQQLDAFSPNPLDNGYTTTTNSPYIGGGGPVGNGAHYVTTTNSNHVTSGQTIWAAGLPCSNLINNPDPIPSLLADPSAPTANLIWTGLGAWGTEYGPTVANALSDTVNASGPSSLNYQGTNGTYPHCTSGYTMQSVYTAPDPKSYAACTMPVSLLATGYQSNRYGYAAVFPAIGGYRWDVSPGEPLGTNNNLAAGVAQGIRNWIYHYDPPLNVGSAYPAAYYHSGSMSKAQVLNNLPAWTADPYFEPALYATCFSGIQLPPQSQYRRPSQDPQLTVTATADNPLRVGGQINPGHFAAAYNNDFSCIDCSAGPGSTPPQLLSLSYTLAVTGTNGYTECTGNNVTGCQYETITRDVDTKSGDIETSTKTTAGFFTATNPPGSSTGAQAVNLTLTNAKATYQYTWFDGTQVRTVIASFTPTLVNGNISRSVIAGTQTP